MVFQEIIREDKGIVLNFFIRLAFGMILHFHETAPWWQNGVTTHLETQSDKPFTVNSLYCGHCRNLELVSSLATVRNSEIDLLTSRALSAKRDRTSEERERAKVRAGSYHTRPENQANDFEKV